MQEPLLLSDGKARKQRKKLLKRLKKSYKIAHTAWEAMNYFDLYFDGRVAAKLGMTAQEFEVFQEKVVNTLSQYCKVRQERMFELMYSMDISVTV